MKMSKTKKEAKQFVRLFIEQAQEAPIKKKRLLKLFKKTVESLPVGTLRDELTGRPKFYIKYLITSLNPGEKTGDAKNDKVTTATTSNGNLPENGVEFENRLPYNLFLKPLCITVDKEVKLECDKKIVDNCLIHQQIKNLSNKKILKLLENQKEEKASTELLKCMQSLCALSVGRVEETKDIDRIMSVFHREIVENTTEILSCKRKRMIEIQRLIYQFLLFFHYLSLGVRESNVVLKPSYEEYMSSFLSLYVDMEICCGQELTEDELQSKGRSLGSKVTLLLDRWPSYVLEVILQLTNHLMQCAKQLLQPLLRKALLQSPKKGCFKEYTKYICCVRHVQACMVADLHLRVEEFVLGVPAPKGYLKWLKEQNSSLLDEIPETKHFKGTRITHFLYKEASEDLLEGLIQLLGTEANDLNGQTEDTAKEDASNVVKEVDPAQTNEPATDGLYFFDTTTAVLPEVTEEDENVLNLRLDEEEENVGSMYEDSESDSESKVSEDEEDDHPKDIIASTASALDAVLNDNEKEEEKEDEKEKEEDEEEEEEEEEDEEDVEMQVEDNQKDNAEGKAADSDSDSEDEGLDAMAAAAEEILNSSRSSESVHEEIHGFVDVKKLPGSPVKEVGGKSPKKPLAKSPAKTTKSLVAMETSTKNSDALDTTKDGSGTMKLIEENVEVIDSDVDSLESSDSEEIGGFTNVKELIRAPLRDAGNKSPLKLKSPVAVASNTRSPIIVKDSPKKASAMSPIVVLSSTDDGSPLPLKAKNTGNSNGQGLSPKGSIRSCTTYESSDASERLSPKRLSPQKAASPKKPNFPVIVCSTESHTDTTATEDESMKSPVSVKKRLRPRKSFIISSPAQPPQSPARRRPSNTSTQSDAESKSPKSQEPQSTSKQLIPEKIIVELDGTRNPTRRRLSDVSVQADKEPKSPMSVTSPGRKVSPLKSPKKLEIQNGSPSKKESSPVKVVTPTLQVPPRRRSLSTSKKTTPLQNDLSVKSPPAKADSPTKKSASPTKKPASPNEVEVVEPTEQEQEYTQINSPPIRMTRELLKRKLAVALEDDANSSADEDTRKIKAKLNLTPVRTSRRRTISNMSKESDVSVKPQSPTKNPQNEIMDFLCSVDTPAQPAGKETKSTRRRSLPARVAVPSPSKLKDTPTRVSRVKISRIDELKSEGQGSPSLEPVKEEGDSPAPRRSSRVRRSSIQLEPPASPRTPNRPNRTRNLAGTPTKKSDAS